MDEAEDLEDAEEVEAVVQDLEVEAEDADLFEAEDADHFEAEDAAEVGGVVEVAAGGVVEAEVDLVVAETGQPFKSIGTMAATLSRRVGMTI